MEEETAQEIEQSEEKSESESEQPKRSRFRALRPQIQSTLDSLQAISEDPKQKPNCRSDAALKRADLLLDLSRLDHKKEVDAALAENATFHEQLDAKDARTAQLEAEVQSLKASQAPVRVEIQPDPEAKQIRAKLLAQSDLIENAVKAVRENVDAPTRLRIAASLVKKMGKSALLFDIGDLDSVCRASLESDETLMGVLDGVSPGVRLGAWGQVCKATLAVRGIEYSSSPRPAQSVPFHNEFI
jgi:hypothetical protein